ncbi:MAG: ABC transporter permease subunit [Clostridia bacterium]|nr:ABC transporter permease subunit [Clostridia bacterium]
MFAIYKREMRSYFTTPIGYVFIAVFLAASGFSFALTTLQVQSSDVSLYFQILMFAYIVILPLLTMKTFAEERRTRTEQLLLTAPVSLPGMVMAKFFAAFTMFFGTLLVSSLYFYPMSLYGDVNWARAWGSLIAMVLIGMTFISIGIFVSSLTENQFTASFGTIGILLALMIVAMLNNIIDSYAVRLVLDWVSIYSRYMNFTYGIFDFGAVVYYASICVVFLFLSVRVFEKRRWS